MNLAKIKYRIADDKVIITETKPLVSKFTLKEQVKSDGKLVVFMEKSNCYTLFSEHPKINELHIGSKLSVEFTEPICEDCVRVTNAELEEYLEKYCPVHVRRYYSKASKLHTIIFTDKQRKE